MNPVGIEINGIHYPVSGENAFAIEHRSAVQQQADIAGSSRRAKTANPEILTWRIDDWSKGEGQKFVDSEDADSWARYHKTNGPVDVRTRGQIKLGFDASTEATITTSGVYKGWLVTTLSKTFLMATISGPTAKIYERTAAGTWTDRTATVTGMAGAQPTRPTSNGTYIYVGQRGTGARVYRIPTNPLGAAVAFTSAGGGENTHVIDNRLYYLISTSGTPNRVLLRRTDNITDAAPLTPTTIGTVGGYSEMSGLDGIGTRVYFSAQDSGEPTRLFAWDGSAVVPVASFGEGFRTPGGSADVAAQTKTALSIQNNVVFVGGYLETSEGNMPALAYYIERDKIPGIVGVIRPGTADYVTATYADTDNGVVFATNLGNVFRYDMTLGGVSEFVKLPSLGGLRVQSISQDQGIWCFSYDDCDGSASNKTIKVAETKTSGTDTYPTSTTIDQSIWDFDLPDEEKLFVDCEVHTDTLPAGSSVTVSFVLDGTTTVTTDASAATTTHSSGTRTKFTMSNAATERVFRFIQPKIQLTAGTDDASTPSVLSVTVRAVSAGKDKFLRCNIDLSGRLGARPTLPDKARAGTLETLIEATSNRVITVKPYFAQRDNPAPVSSSSYVCKIDASRISFAPPASAELLLRVLG